jgi:chorismate synthase
LPGGFLSNNAGGVLGSISTGQDLDVLHCINGNIPSSRRGRRSTRLATVRSRDQAPRPGGHTRHPIAEALLALVVMEHATARKMPTCAWYARHRQPG